MFVAVIGLSQYRLECVLRELAEKRDVRLSSVQSCDDTLDSRTATVLDAVSQIFLDRDTSKSEDIYGKAIVVSTTCYNLFDSLEEIDCEYIDGLAKKAYDIFDATVFVSDGNMALSALPYLARPVELHESELVTFLSNLREEV